MHSLVMACANYSRSEIHMNFSMVRTCALALLTDRFFHDALQISAGLLYRNLTKLEMLKLYIKKKKSSYPNFRNLSFSTSVVVRFIQ